MEEEPEQSSDPLFAEPLFGSLQYGALGPFYHRSEGALVTLRSNASDGPSLATKGGIAGRQLDLIGRLIKQQKRQKILFCFFCLSFFCPWRPLCVCGSSRRLRRSMLLFGAQKNAKSSVRLLTNAALAPLTAGKGKLSRQCKKNEKRDWMHCPSSGSFLTGFDAAFASSFAFASAGDYKSRLPRGHSAGNVLRRLLSLHQRN